MTNLEIINYIFNILQQYYIIFFIIQLLTFIIICLFSLYFFKLLPRYSRIVATCILFCTSICCTQCISFKLLFLCVLYWGAYREFFSKILKMFGADFSKWPHRTTNQSLKLLYQLFYEIIYTTVQLFILVILIIIIGGNFCLFIFLRVSTAFSIFSIQAIIAFYFFVILIIMLLILIIIRGGSIRIRLDQLNLSNFTTALISILPLILVFIILYMIL